MVRVDPNLRLIIDAAEKLIGTLDFRSFLQCILGRNSPRAAMADSASIFSYNESAYRFIEGSKTPITSLVEILP